MEQLTGGGTTSRTLGERAARVLEEEERWLALARAAATRELERRTQAARRGARDAESLRELRDEAARARDDDLPQVLHELAVRHRLAEREAAPVPDPLAPYFAHLKVRENGAIKDYFLGGATLLEPRDGLRVVDWRRAPVAELFYTHRVGDLYEKEVPGRTLEGEILARRIVVVAGGKLERVECDDVSIQRTAEGFCEAPRAALVAGGAGTASRAAGAEVTALLDPEQYAAVTAPADEALLVLGSAGSGKTTVALHRLSRVCANAAELDSTRVVVPEEGLARLSRRLLTSLDGAVHAERVVTLDGFAIELAKAELGGLPALCHDAPGDVVALKRHPALFDALTEDLARHAGLRSYKKVLARLRVLFSDRAFLAKVVARARGSLSSASIEATVRHTMLQLAEPVSRALASITVSEMKRAIDGRDIAEGTPDELAGTIDVEDLPILLYAKGLSGELSGAGYGHLVIDEAEDFSLFEVDVLGRCLASPKSVTVAGDDAQQTTSSFPGWQRILDTLGVPSARRCKLATSYRCPRPIAEAARRILGPLAPAEPIVTARDGAPVSVHRFARAEQAELFVSDAVRDLVTREPHASIAVLARDDDAARAFHATFADLPEARFVPDGEFTFEPGVDFACVDSAKGLEFDYVIVPDATFASYPATDEARRRLHVAATRAAHQLWLVAGGAPSPLITDVGARNAP